MFASSLQDWNTNLPISSAHALDSVAGLFSVEARIGKPPVIVGPLAPR